MPILALLLQNGPDPAQIQRNALAFMAIFPLIILAFYLVRVTLLVIPFWSICRKAGFSPWLSLLNAIPLGNLILIYVLGFAEWNTVAAPVMAWQPPIPPPPAPPAMPPQA